MMTNSSERTRFVLSQLLRANSASPIVVSYSRGTDFWQVRKELHMADIRGKLVGLCEAFNAHDLDRIMMSFFPTTASWKCRGDRTLGGRALKESKPCAKDWHHGLKACLTSITGTSSTSSIRISRPACQNGH